MTDIVGQIAGLGGLATFSQLREAGFSAATVQRSVGAGVTRVRHGVYASTDAPADLLRAARVGGALAAASAAPRHHLWEPPRRLLHVSVGRHVRALQHPDLPRPLEPADDVRIIRDGGQLDPARERWVVSTPRCLAQAIRHESEEYAIAMLDSALRAARDDKGRELRPAHPATLLDQVRALIPQRLWNRIDLSEPRAESGSESVARVRYGRAGILVIPQVPVARGIRVDLLIGDRLVIEVGSFLHHGDRDAYERDGARRATLQRLGFVVLDFTYKQVLHDWETVLSTTLAAMGRGEHVGRLHPW